MSLAHGEPSPVHYDVSFASSDNHYVDVTATLPSAGANQTFMMPVWTPGSYLVRDYSRHIDSVTALDDAGELLPVKKVSKNRWQVSNEKEHAITLKYRVYCRELSVRTNFVDRDFAVLNGAALFLTTDESLDSEHIVHLNLPERWKQSVTSLERRVTDGPNVFVATNYDELVDSPIVVGNPRLHPFQCGAVQHYLVNIGGDGLWDGERAAADVARIVQTHQEMWGSVPYQSYYFLNVIAESGGGLEHDNSTLMLTSRWTYRDPKRYRSWLGLVSHEFFHTWNVRRLRPRALVKYRYGAENYFRELWVAEGVTSYYDDLALVRAGISKPDEYLKDLTKQIERLQNTEGRLRQSLADSSYDSWIKFYRPNENSSNTTISYYNKGAIVAFLLDIEIRRLTDNKRSLDDVMQKLYESFALKDGYTNQDVMETVNGIVKSDWESWFENAIHSTEELDYQPALNWLGLEFARDARLRAEKTKPADSQETETKAAELDQVWIGMKTQWSEGRLTVTNVVENGPAARAGINPEDEIIAVNNFRVNAQQEDLFKPFLKDKTADVLISRRGALRAITTELEIRSMDQWKLKVRDDVSDAQKASFSAWLHQDIQSESSNQDKQ
ncbi:MAG: PDZ domain-containing protein [Planctomycetota bacterium]